jgi:carbon monoxide dehydrogenase subunit G
MEFDSEFTVKAPIDEVYDALLDLERVTPAMPGAQVLEKIDDDHYKVAIKVKMGPVSMTYRGDVTVVEKDPEAHRAVLDVKAREARGQGSATAKVTMSLEPEGDDAARGTMKAQVQLSGKAAAMSRGVIDDVSKRLVTTFAENLEGIVGAPEPEPEPEAAPAGEAAATPKPPPPSPAKPRSEPSQADALDMGPLAAGMAADRLRDPKVLGALLGGTLLAGYLIGRRS